MRAQRERRSLRPRVFYRIIIYFHIDFQFCTQSEIYSTPLPAFNAKQDHCTVLHKILIFYMKRGPPYIARCLQNETKFIVRFQNIKHRESFDLFRVFSNWCPHMKYKKIMKEIRAYIPRYCMRDYHFTNFLAKFTFKRMYNYEDLI